MKSAIEEHGIAEAVCRWWAIAGTDIIKWQAAINWLHGAGHLHPDEEVGGELWFLSQNLYERKMLP